jgi:hypothetical protein
VVSTKRWVKWASTIAAITLIGAMLYVAVFRNDTRAGYLILGLLILCSFAYKWATRL